MLKPAPTNRRTTDAHWETDLYQWRSYMGGHPAAMPSDVVVLASGVDGRYTGSIRRYPGHILIEDLRRLPMLGDLYDEDISGLTIPSWVRDSSVSAGGHAWEHKAIAVSAAMAARADTPVLQQVYPFTMSVQSPNVGRTVLGGYVVRIRTDVLNAVATNTIDTSTYTGAKDTTSPTGLAWGHFSDASLTEANDYVLGILVYLPSATNGRTESSTTRSNFRLILPLQPKYYNFLGYSTSGGPNTLEDTVGDLPAAYRARWQQLAHYIDNQMTPDSDLPWCSEIDREQMTSGLTLTGTGSGNTVVLSGGASASDDYYIGSWLKITAGTGVGQGGFVIDYDGASKTATIDHDWDTNPSASTINLTEPLQRTDLIKCADDVAVSCDGRFLNVFSTTGEFDPVTIWFDDQYFGCPHPQKITAVSTAWTYADIDDPRLSWMTAARAYGWHWEIHGYSGCFWNRTTKETPLTLTGVNSTHGTATSSKTYSVRVRWWDSYRNRYTSMTAPATLLLGASDDSITCKIPLVLTEFDVRGSEAGLSTLQAEESARVQRLLMFHYYEPYVTLKNGGTLYRACTFGHTWAAIQFDKVNLPYDANEPNTPGEPTYRLTAQSLSKLWLMQNPVASTAGAGGHSTSTIKLNSSASTVDDYYYGAWITWNTYTRRIEAYDGTTKVATVSPVFGGTPIDGDAYSIEWDYDTYAQLYYPYTTTTVWQDEDSGGELYPSWHDYIACTEEYLVTQDYYDELTHDLHLPPSSVGDCIVYKRMGVVASKKTLVKSTVEKLGTVTTNEPRYADSNVYVLHWTEPFVRETYPLGRTHTTQHLASQPIQMVVAGQSLWVFGSGPTLKGTYVGGTISWAQVGTAFRLPNNSSVCEAKGVLFGVFTDGAYLIEPNTGVPTPVTGLDRVLRDHWPDLSEISVAYDSKLDAIYVNNPTYHSTVILWMKTQIVTTLQQHNFQWVTTLEVNGDQRVVLVTPQGRFVMAEYDTVTDTFCKPMHGRMISSAPESWPYFKISGTPTVTTDVHGATVTRVEVAASSPNAREVLYRDAEAALVTATQDYYWYGTPVYGVGRTNWGVRLTIAAVKTETSPAKYYLYFVGDQSSVLAADQWYTFDPVVVHVTWGPLESADQESSSFLKRDVRNLALGMLDVDGSTLEDFSETDVPLFEVGVVEPSSFKAATPQTTDGSAGFVRTNTTTAEQDAARLVPDTGKTYVPNDATSLMTAWSSGVQGTLLFPYMKTFLTPLVFDLRELSVGGTIYNTENVRGV